MHKSLELIDEAFLSDLKILLRNPIGVDKYLKKRTRVIDKALSERFSENGLSSRYILCAIGGYGREELFPASDIDLTIIDQDPKKKPDEELNNFVSWLWDQNFKVGHSVRSVPAMQKLARNDLQEYTSLLSIRVLSGSKKNITVFNRDLKALHKKIRKKVFFNFKENEAIERYQKFNSTEFNLEPDIKESPGCLRDIHSVEWICQKCLEIDSIKKLKMDIFNRSEMKSLLNSSRRMKIIRYWLNLKSNQNRLSFELQVDAAKQFNYRNSKSLSAVEKFMKDFFNDASTITDFHQLFLQACIEDPGHFGSNIDFDRLIKGITKKFIYDGEINSPSDILDVFQKLGGNKNLFELNLQTAYKIKLALKKIQDKQFLHKKIQQQFLELLKSKHHLSSILKKMKQLGILGKIIPEFKMIQGQMQFDMFHIYTVDEHTFKVVRNMRQMYIGTNIKDFDMESELIRKLPKIEILYLAGLFHDLGKGKGGNHSEIGSSMVHDFALRARISKADEELLVWLVKNHLFMSSIAQKKDVHDKHTVDEFIGTVNTIEKLNYLFLLTINDIRGTNPNLWNSWKHDLLKSLYITSRSILNQEEVPQKVSIRDRKARTLEAFSKAEINKISKIWKMLPESYFQKNNIASLKSHAEIITNYDGQSSAGIQKLNDYISLTLFSANRKGLFFRACELIDSMMLETYDADIQTTNDNKFALNSFLVKHRKLGNNLYKSDFESIINKINKGILSPTSNIKLSKKIKKPFQMVTKINFSEDKNLMKTLLCIETLDQPKLLVKIAKSFLDLNIDVHSARITTLGERVEDNFQLLDSKNGKFLTKNKKNDLTKSLNNL